MLQEDGSGWVSNEGEFIQFLLFTQVILNSECCMFPKLPAQEHWTWQVAPNLSSRPPFPFFQSPPYHKPFTLPIQPPHPLHFPHPCRTLHLKHWSIISMTLVTPFSESPHVSRGLNVRSRSVWQRQVVWGRSTRVSSSGHLGGDSGGHGLLISNSPTSLVEPQLSPNSSVPLSATISLPLHPLNPSSGPQPTHLPM